MVHYDLPNLGDTYQWQFHGFCFQGHNKMVCSVDWAEETSLCNLFSGGFDRHVYGWHINLPTKDNKE